MVYSRVIRSIGKVSNLKDLKGSLCQLMDEAGQI